MEASNRVAILGVTGFIGSGLPKLLQERGFGVTGVSRRGSGRVEGVDRWQGLENLDLAGHRVVINLAGEPVARRWTAANRRRFHESRVGVTRRVVEAMRRLPAHQRPALLINGSAVGIYGDRGDECLDEASAVGSGYLADLCRDWEDAALEARTLGVRVLRLRIGVVLGRGGEAFERLLMVFKTGLGGRLGHGRQWMPWIHVEDLREAILHAIGSESLGTTVNGTAPVPERNADFTRKLAKALHRPAVLPVPGFALKLALGGFGGALLQGQQALPKALLDDGFRFRYPTLEQALAELTGPATCKRD